MPRAYLVFNPLAGRFPSKQSMEAAARILQDQGWAVDLFQANSGEHISQLARQAADAGLEAFFIAGGDGSVNLAAGMLVGSETALGVLPAGTANVWAQEIGMPGQGWMTKFSLEESARSFVNSQIRPIDVGLCNGRPFLLWAGIGLDAYVVHQIEPREPWEKRFAVVQYMASAVWNASFWHGSNMKLVFNGQVIEDHFLMAIVSNIHLYAGGIAELAPEARLDDGLLDLFLFKGDWMGDTVQRFWDLWAGRHLQSDHVTRYPVQSLSIESGETLFLQVDGEPDEARQAIQIEVKPRALKVIVPSRTPHPLFVDTGPRDERRSSPPITGHSGEP